MNTNERDALNALSGKVIRAGYHVSNGLGCGFLEKVYENAMVLELRAMGLSVEQQKAISVRYRQEIVGDYLADLLVEERIVVKLKVVRFVDAVHRAQCINYLRATSLPLCLLMNFARPRLEVHRIING